jgi:serine/threonine-protein kinase
MRLVENAVVAGRFRLNRLIQSGGMGSVWHATHLGLDIPCAVKFVKGDLLENEDVISRFEREAKSAAQLRSPHVVQILDHGVCEGTPYIAMELLDGEDLEVRLEKNGPLRPADLHKVMSEVCRALSKAHAMGIVHRDLKPANIYLVRDDDHEITKVLDFGIAKTRVNELAGSATKTGAMLGTPYYMSPEQAQGTKTVDFRSDLWSLAVIAYQCLTGKLPFESEALGDLLMKIMVAPIPVPSQVASVPSSFDRWWAKAASRDAAERFQSAKEFSDSLAVVCGVSQVSSVIDRSKLHIKPGTLPDAPTEGDAEHAAASPWTPEGGHHGQPTIPIPLTSPANATRVPDIGAATTPGAAPAAGGVMAGTPAPLSRSLSREISEPPASRTGLVVALTLGCVLFAGALVGAGWHFYGARADAASASTPTSSTPAPAPSPPVAPPSTGSPPEPTPSVSAAPVASAPPPPGASSSPSTPAAPHAAPQSGGPGAISHAKPAVPPSKPPSEPVLTPSKPPSEPAPKPAKPGQPAELGF